MRAPVLLVLLLLVAPSGGCSGEADLSELPRLRLAPLRTLDHPGPQRFTQGLVFYGGVLFEGTGLYEATALRRLDPQSGALLQQASSAQLFPGEPPYFGEGIAVWDRTLIQLSWRQGKARRFALDLTPLGGTFSYAGEGWGLTHDGTQLIRSDGSATLHRHDPRTFVELGTVTVRAGGTPLAGLNELEWVAGRLWANLIDRSEIVVIDPRSGEAVALLDGASLRCARTPGTVNVLNGIAHDPEEGALYLTGKNCPVIEVFKIVD